MATGRLPDPNTAPVTAKGDLYTYSTVPAKLAVGNNGETLVADSSTSTGLRWQGNFAAGKNKIINGAFDIWQRGTSFTPANGTATYTADRFYIFMSGTYSATVSQQSFTAGSAPAAPYEGQFFWRNTISSITGSLSFNRFAQRIEDVRTLANQAVTISFWAKAGANASWTPQLVQDFGSGGSSAVFTSGTAVSVTASWQRFTQTITLPSISGKTIGTGNNLTFLIDMPVSGAQTNDVWGVQVEAGNTATVFQTATGTLEGELAACQRYYYKHAATGANSGITPGGFYSATTLIGIVTFPITMRTSPTFSAVTGTNYYQSVRNGGVNNLNSLSQDTANANASQIFNNTEASGTAGHYANIIANNASASIAWSAEL